MAWTGEREIKNQLQKMWDKGAILAAIVSRESLFPLRIALKSPSSSELSTAFAAVQDWIAHWHAVRKIRVEMRDVQHRVIGSNQVPVAVWIDSQADALALIGKAPDAGRFQSILAITPLTLRPWLHKRPLKALALVADWPQLLSIVAWLDLHPRPQIYLRQMDLPGVHSKLIEAHRAVLAELFDLQLSPAVIDDSAHGVAGFCQRYGFLDKPLRVRYRVPSGTLFEQDVMLTAAAFAALELDVDYVFITENEINFLAFPALARSAVILGAGYGFEMLADARWLQQKALYYWGDIDSHGFAILDQLRLRFPSVRSLLMNEPTLFRYQALWGHEPVPVRHDLPRLDAAETKVFNLLRDETLGANVRLEQEKIAYADLLAALAELGDGFTLKEET
ncbi:DUF3322 domain-containing protein [Deefgea salmonis]|uniref:DUF3322 domain-containing protein n=1 Tax=Deefgea salmonis TaxID=2875502 RepID=A0ABS8BI37_9NEIS|nr:DUF3322 domain-containing protein [Deefgea salmonis]MCB5195256.1 DUF3322 domain-containing protein [Deefgea salmonis]